MSKISFGVTNFGVIKFLILSLLVGLHSTLSLAGAQSKKFKYNPDATDLNLKNDLSKPKNKAVKPATFVDKKKKIKNKKPKTCHNGKCKSCYSTTYKPLWCDESLNIPIDHHAGNMGPNGRNYDGIPWYIDDGYSHYNSFW